MVELKMPFNLTSLPILATLLSLLNQLFLALQHAEVLFRAKIAQMFVTGLSWGNHYRQTKLCDPGWFGLNSTTNVCINSSDSGVLRAWYIAPEGFSGDTIEQLTPDDTVILYLHGIRNHRGVSSSVALYKHLSSLGYYTLAPDFRGFGDSSPVPQLSETTLVRPLAGICRGRPSRDTA